MKGRRTDLCIQTSPEALILNFPACSQTSSVSPTVTSSCPSKETSLSLSQELSIHKLQSDCSYQSRRTSELEQEIYSCLQQNMMISQELAETKKFKTMYEQQTQTIHNLRNENERLKKIIQNKQNNNCDVLLYEMKKKIANKDLIIRELQAQIREQQIEMNLRRQEARNELDTSDLSVATEKSTHTQNVREIMAKPSKIRQERVD